MDMFDMMGGMMGNMGNMGNMVNILSDSSHMFTKQLICHGESNILQCNVYNLYLLICVCVCVCPSIPQDRMSGSPNCQTFSSSTVISYSSLDQGAPKVYQQTSEVRTAPGGVSMTFKHQALT